MVLTIFGRGERANEETVVGLLNQLHRAYTDLLLHGVGIHLYLAVRAPVKFSK